MRTNVLIIEPDIDNINVFKKELSIRSTINSVQLIFSVDFDEVNDFQYLKKIHIIILSEANILEKTISRIETIKSIKSIAKVIVLTKDKPRDELIDLYKKNGADFVIEKNDLQEIKNSIIYIQNKG